MTMKYASSIRGTLTGTRWMAATSILCCLRRSRNLSTRKREEQTWSRQSQSPWILASDNRPSFFPPRVSWLALRRAYPPPFVRTTSPPRTPRDPPSPAPWLEGCGKVILDQLMPAKPNSTAALAAHLYKSNSLRIDSATRSAIARLQASNSRNAESLSPPYVHHTMYLCTRLRSAYMESATLRGREPRRKRMAMGCIDPRALAATGIENL